jgi:hypothetical protein
MYVQYSTLCKVLDGDRSVLSRFNFESYHISANWVDEPLPTDARIWVSKQCYPQQTPLWVYGAPSL